MSVFLKLNHNILKLNAVTVPFINVLYQERELNIN